MLRPVAAALLLLLAACGAQAADEAAGTINPWGLLGVLAALGVGMAGVGLHGRALERRWVQEQEHAQREETSRKRYGGTLWKP